LWTISNEYLDDPLITVVGCGGTGGFVAEGLCRLLIQRLGRILLVDHDVVEEHNLLRQNFYSEDLGQFKAKALALRLASRFRRPVRYSVLPWAEGSQAGVYDRSSGIIVGCVDNHIARRALAAGFEHYHGGGSRHIWWLDAGNSQESGQLILGNSTSRNLEMSFLQGPDIARALPLPSVQQPALLEPAWEPEPVAADCAQAIEAGNQSPTINQVMASLALEYVRQLLAGTLTSMATYVDTRAGTMSAVPATPEQVAKLIHVRVSRLVEKGTPWQAPVCPRCGRVHG